MSSQLARNFLNSKGSKTKQLFHGSVLRMAKEGLCKPGVVDSKPTIAKETVNAIPNNFDPALASLFASTVSIWSMRSIDDSWC